MAIPGKGTRVLTNLNHGGHALSEELFQATPNAEAREDIGRLREVTRNAAIDTASKDDTTPFHYLFENLADRYPTAHLPTTTPEAVVVALKALGSAMIDQDPVDGLNVNAPIPPVFTYWGQFIDHDLTANTDRDKDLSIVDAVFDPEHPDDVVAQLGNLRQPALNLDSLYGDGPAASGQSGAVPYVDGKRFKLGTLTPTTPGGPVRTEPVPPLLGTRDLPRVEAPGTADLPTGTALIGDGRNDENLVVAQLHVAFLHFHNKVVDWVEANDPQPDAPATFERARQLVRWTYQWLVVNQFLPQLVVQEALDAVAANPLFAGTSTGTYMPLEFSVAAFRFGHSMVRGAYDWNRNFGRLAGQPDTHASFDLLFAFTGKARPIFLGTGDTLPDNWPVEWDRLVDDPPLFQDRLARKIDTHLAFPLNRMVNEGNDPHLAERVRRLLKRLAVRNLLRGYKLGIPTGQAVAAELGVPALTRAQLNSGAGTVLGDALADGGFLDATPLWFYILKEAEIGGGGKLGVVGGRIVAETLRGQIRLDPDSFENAGNGWTPDAGVKDANGNPVRTIADLFRFAGVLV
jgi:heme peroxidase